MYKIPLVFTIASLVAIGFLSYANAEEIQYSENFEVEISHPVSDQYCRTQYDSFVPVTVCVFEGITPDGSDRVWDFVEKEWTTQAELELEAKAEYAKWLEDNPPEEEPTYWEQKLQAINPDTDNATDQILIDRINDMLGAQCYQGVGQSTGVQTVRGFDIPTEEYVDKDGVTKLRLSEKIIYKNVDLRGFLGIIEKHRQECIAQNEIENGKYVTNRSELAIAQSHDVAVYHSDVAKDIPVWSQNRVNQESNEQTQDIQSFVSDAICNGYYSMQMKISYGCQDTYDYTNNYAAPEMKDLVKTNDVLKKAYEYTLDNGAAQAEEVKKKNLQKYVEGHRN